MPVSPAEDVIRFGLFTLDRKAGQLTRNGSTLRLPQQPLQLLAMLVERPGEILTRDELRRRLWPSDVFVDFDHGLNKSIQKLRDALGDSAASPRYIETIPRVGYRFIAPVRNGTPPSEPEPTMEIPAAPVPVPVIVTANRRGVRWWILGGSLALAGALGAVYFNSRPSHLALKYTQLTDFTDSVTTPALSPDGHMLAFIRSGSTFLSTDPIYVKILPHGETHRLTDKGQAKYNLAFSPDGSQLAYSVMEGGGFSTYSVSVLGGEPHRLLSNAAALTWLDPDHYLFSRIRSGLHMGLVSQSVSGSNFREIYYPAHERAMVHYSYASPDRKWGLVVEMDAQGNWSPCKLVELDSRAEAKPVGPDGGCTSAGWSPDGMWMYFIASVEGKGHLWRQRFSGGRPEQITFGPAEEQGLAVDPDGRSVITAVGAYEDAIWVHDAKGERALSSEGEVVEDSNTPSFASDAKTLYYLMRHASAGGGAELWRMDSDSGKSEAVFPGVAIDHYDVSQDGKQVVYSATSKDGTSRLWLAPIDRSSAAREIGDANESWPFFAPQGNIGFQRSEGNANYLEMMATDGSGRVKILPEPVLEIQGVSPGRTWLFGVVSHLEGKRAVATPVAIPLKGGMPRLVSHVYCMSRWSPNGKFLILSLGFPSETNPGRSLVIAAGPDESLPSFPAEGLTPTTDAKTIPGSQWIDNYGIVPGNDLSHFAYVKYTTHRNLYRISLR